MENANIQKTRNYARDYALMEEKDFSNFFANYENVDDKIKPIKREIKKLNAQLGDLQQNITDIYKGRYNNTFTPTEIKTYIEYHKYSRGYCSSSEKYFSLGGQLLSSKDLDEYDTHITISTLRGQFTILKGYCLELASVIFQVYSYSIKNNTIAINSICEILYPLMDGHPICKDFNGEDASLNNVPSLAEYNAAEFIELFYGISRDRFPSGISLSQLKRYITENVNFETILKTAPMEIADILLSQQMQTRKNIYEMLDVNKKEFAILAEHKLTQKWYYLREYLLCLDDELKAKVNKTNPEWIEFLIKAKEWEEVFSFYSVKYDQKGVGLQLLIQYLGKTERHYYGKTFSFFPNYYTLGDFCAYVTQEVVNQAMQSIPEYITYLGDYIQMCEQKGLRPILYSSYIIQTHNIAKRNLEIKLTPEQEETFVNQYNKFKTWKDKVNGYTIIPPTESKDVVQEGSNLSHCAASYVLSIISGRCLVVFLRKIAQIGESLVTIEIRDKKVVQARGFCNRKITEEEGVIIQKFCKDNNLAYGVHNY